MVGHNDLEAEIGRVVKNLSQGDATRTVPLDLIERTVRDCFDERRDARIKDFVGLFAERAARDRLRSIANEPLASHSQTG
jgi:hypothetical protein